MFSTFLVVLSNLWFSWEVWTVSCFSLYSTTIHSKNQVPWHLSMGSWLSNDANLAREEFNLWPLDEFNIKLLNEVHPKHWISPLQGQEVDAMEYFDLVSIGSGAGGLVSSRQVSIHTLFYLQPRAIRVPYTP